MVKHRRFSDKPKDNQAQENEKIETKEQQTLSKTSHMEMIPSF